MGVSRAVGGGLLVASLLVAPVVAQSSPGTRNGLPDRFDVGRPVGLGPQYKYTYSYERGIMVSVDRGPFLCSRTALIVTDQ